MQGRGRGDAVKLHQDRTNLHWSGDGVRRGGGAYGGDAAPHDGAVVDVGSGYADVSVARDEVVERVGNVGENGIGWRALGAADEAGGSVVASGGYEGADGEVGADDDG